jgi:hypothetical protein
MYTIEQCLRMDLRARQFRSMLEQVVNMMELVNVLGFSPSQIVFDPKQVYVAQGLRLKFVYLPVTGYQSEDRGVLDLLIYLTSYARFENAKNYRDSMKILDYLRRQTVFSLIDLKSFLGMDENYSRQETSEGLIAKPLGVPSGKLVRDFITESGGGGGLDS